MSKIAIGLLSLTIGIVVGAGLMKYNMECECVEEITPDDGPLRRYNNLPEEKILITSENRYKKIAKTYRAKEVDPMPINKEPHLISIDQFSEDGDNEKITVYYYNKDNILIDDDEKIIDDIEDVIGEDAINCFATPGYGVVYVRNNRLGIDYEIVLQTGEYIKE